MDAPEKFLTIDELPPYLLAVYGITLTVSSIRLMRLRGDGPEPELGTWRLYFSRASIHAWVERLQANAGQREQRRQEKRRAKFLATLPTVKVSRWETVLDEWAMDPVTGRRLEGLTIVHSAPPPGGKIYAAADLAALLRERLK